MQRDTGKECSDVLMARITYNKADVHQLGKQDRSLDVSRGGDVDGVADIVA